MINIKEIFTDNDSVIIRVEGILDSKSIPILRHVLDRNLKNKRKVTLAGLEYLTHVDRAARIFLRGIRDKITFNDLNEFLKMEINDSE